MAQLILTFLFLFFQATQRRRLYPSIDRFKKECDLYMGVIKATPRMLDSYEEKESSELSAEKRGMCDAAARLGFSLHFPLDTQDKVRKGQRPLPLLRPPPRLTSSGLFVPTR